MLFYIFVLFEELILRESLEYDFLDNVSLSLSYASQVGLTSEGFSVTFLFLYCFK